MRPPTVRHNVGRLTALSLVGAALDRGSAFLLVAVIAALFGASHESDLYFLALVVPTAVGGALSDAFYTVHLPIFTRGDEGLSLTVAIRRAAVLAGALTCLYVVVLLVVSPRALIVWLLPAPILLTMSLTGVYAAFFVARRRYLLAVMRVPLATALALALVFVFVPLSRSAGALAGSIAVANLAVLLLLIARAPRWARVRKRNSPNHSYRQTLNATASAFVATIVGGPLVVIVERALASTLATGAVALLIFSRNLASVPGLIATALASGIFPAAAARQAGVERKSLAKLMLGSVRIGVLIALVSIAFLIVCRVEIVRVALQRGELHQAQAHTITRLLVIVSWSLLGASVVVLVNRAFFAMERYRVVAALSAASLTVYIAMAAILRWQLGIDGLALAFSIALIGTGFASGALLVRALKLLPRQVVGEWLLLPALLSVVFAAGAYVGRLALATSSPTAWRAIETLVVSLLAGMAALALAASTFRTKEYVVVRNVLRRRPVASTLR